MAVVRFSAAHDAQRAIVYAQDADKRCRDYTCRECGMPVQVCYGDIVTTPYFRHRVREFASGKHCEYRDETYAHRQAKAVLLQQGWVTVPPVFARRMAGYEGPTLRLHPAVKVMATHVYLERTLFENTDCGLDFYRQQRPFVEEPGRQDFVCRPDVIFTDAADKPILLIEIHVTHEVNYEKLVGLRRAQIDTIEITVPWFYTAKEIEKLLSSHASTTWLYNHERETTDPVGPDTPGIAPLDRDDFEEIRPLGPEPIECQLFEIRQALRSLKKFMAGAAVGALRERFATASGELAAAASREADDCAAAIASGEEQLRQAFAAAAADLGAETVRLTGLYESDQEAIGRKTAAVEHDLAAAYRGTAGALRERVDERRSAYQATENAIATSRQQLSERLMAAQERLTEDFQPETARLERTTAGVEHATAAEQRTQARLGRLADYLHARSRREVGRLHGLLPELTAMQRERARLSLLANQLGQHAHRLADEGSALNRAEAALGGPAKAVA
jgi:hypothetical protein